MKKFRKILAFALATLCLTFANGAFAQESLLQQENTPAQINAPLQAGACDTVKIYFAGSEAPTLVEGQAIMKLYSADGTVLLDTKAYEIKKGYSAFEVLFNVPQYPIGTKFKFVVSGDVNGVEFNGATAAEHIIETYAMPNAAGIDEYYTSFMMKLIPKWNKEAIISVPGTEQTLFYHCLTEDEVYVTTDLLGVLGISCITDYAAEKPNFTLTGNDGARVATFYVNDIYATFGGVGENLKAPAFTIGEMPYVPLTRIAQYFECGYKLTEENQYCRRISLTPVVKAQPPVQSAPAAATPLDNSYVNSIDIYSKTDYLVWVDKSEFKVNVYLGSNRNWRQIQSFPCAIGAPRTPTIEGSFEYYQKQDRWQYNGYYCGPIMRFKGGYALHSVLLNNNGTYRDGRVGVRISHGCVRMLPKDINWMVSYVPLYTRILVTA